MSGRFAEYECTVSQGNKRILGTESDGLDSRNVSDAPEGGAAGSVEEIDCKEQTSKINGDLFLKSEIDNNTLLEWISTLCYSLKCSNI